MTAQDVDSAVAGLRSLLRLGAVTPTTVLACPPLLLLAEVRGIGDDEADRAVILADALLRAVETLPERDAARALLGVSRFTKGQPLGSRRAAAAEMVSVKPDSFRLRREPGLLRELSRALIVELAAEPAKREARQVLRRVSALRARQREFVSVGNVERLVRGKPALSDVARELVQDVAALWPHETVETTKAFASDLTAALLDELAGVDPDHLAAWLETVLLVGSAVVPSSQQPGLGPLRLRTREDFLTFSELSDQSLATLERALGDVGRQEAVMVTATLVAHEEGRIGAPTGIVVGTTHVYSGKEGLGLGRVAVRADVDDAAAGAAEGGPIFHALRNAGYFVVATPKHEQRLIRAITLPVVAPADLRALEGDDLPRKTYTRRWLSGCGLTELVARKEVSCSAQQAHTGRRLLDEYVEQTGRTLPVVIPAIRVENSRSHRVFRSPIGPIERELPGNSIDNLRLMQRILGPRARIWLAEAGVEYSPTGALVEPEWRVRLGPDTFVPGDVALLQPERAEWIDVFTFEDKLRLSELERPVALSYTRSEDLVLLRAVGALDPHFETRPPIWLVASRSLRSERALAADVGELLLRLYGSRGDPETLRDQGTASFRTPGLVLGGGGKNPRHWLTRELERMLAFLAGLMTDTPREQATASGAPDDADEAHVRAAALERQATAASGRPLVAEKPDGSLADLAQDWPEAKLEHDRRSESLALVDSAFEFNLSDADRIALREAAHEVARYDVATEADAYVIEAQIQAMRLSVELRRRLLHFRRFGSPVGGLLIGGVPTGEVPATPRHADYAVGARLLGAAAMSIIVSVLGEQYGFRPELGGHIVQDIVPVRGFEDTQEAISSSTPLEGRIDKAFSENRADHLGLLCLRPDHDGEAATTLSTIGAIVPLLEPHTIAVLRQPRFETMVDSSFLRGAGIGRPIHIGPITVLSGDAQHPRLRADMAETRGLDAAAQEALDRLKAAARMVSLTVYLKAGDLLLVDNRVSLSGRTSFTARWDGNDRWLLRTFITSDLARGAPARPGDGRIVDEDLTVEP